MSTGVKYVLVKWLWILKRNGNEKFQHILEFVNIVLFDLTNSHYKPMGSLALLGGSCTLIDFLEERGPIVTSPISILWCMTMLTFILILLY